MPDESDFTDEQLARINEIHNAAYDLCRILAEKEDLEWDMSYIGEVADYASNLLVDRGFRVYYPERVADNDGNLIISEYYE